ncbi:MAG TPA: GNAT family N-acetyltransferase [Hyphomicrobiaceae bacterium]|nr:GNAT family N-acetyltransferase [Hyphomicrobiaceae bacterium]
MTFLEGAARSFVSLRRVGLDDHADVRYLHAQSMRSQCGDSLSDAELAAFLSFVGSPDYSDHLRTQELHGAYFEGQLVGTASWLVNGDDGKTARIASVYVHPMFTRLGIGSRLLAEVEAGARQSGFEHLGASATINAVPFFECHGYAEASRGVKAFGPECWLPVAFLRKRVE